MRPVSSRPVDGPGQLPRPGTSHPASRPPAAPPPYRRHKSLERGAHGFAPGRNSLLLERVGDPPSESNNRVLTAAPAQPPVVDVEARYSDASRDWVLMYRFTFPDPT